MRELNVWLWFFYRLLLPKKILAWQTFFLLCLVFWVLAIFHQDSQRDILSSMGVLSLIASTWFFLQERPLVIFGFSLGNWILSLFLAIFISAGLFEEISYIPWVISPLITAVITLIPEFVDSSFKVSLPKPQDRPRILIIIFIHIILSCWIQFHFTINHWLASKPELLERDFDNSAFVIRMNYQDWRR